MLALNILAWRSCGPKESGGLQFTEGHKESEITEATEHAPHVYFSYSSTGDKN